MVFINYFYLSRWNRYLQFCSYKNISIDGTANGSQHKLPVQELIEIFYVYLIEGPHKNISSSVANQYISVVGKHLLEANVISSMKEIRTPEFKAFQNKYLATVQERAISKNEAIIESVKTFEV